MTSYQSPSAAPPNHPVTITIDCTAAPDVQSGTPHRITLHSDWRVDSAHDLEAERVGRSLGSWCSCLHFVDRIIPIYREAMHIMADPAQLPRRGNRWGNIQSDPAQSDGVSNVGPLRFPHANLADALAQELSPQHLLAITRNISQAGDELAPLEHRMYKKLFSQAGRVWAGAGDPHQIDGGQDSFYSLWLEGIPSVKIDEIARSLPKAAWPLPEDFYRRAYLDIEGSWLYNAVSCFPTREFVEWASRQEFTWDRTKFKTVWRVHEVGLSVGDAIALLESGERSN